MEEPQRIQRVHKAREAYDKKTRSLASAAALFLDEYSQDIEEMVNSEAVDNLHIRKHWSELQSLYRCYRQKQSDFLRAVTYPITGTLDS